MPRPLDELNHANFVIIPNCSQSHSKRSSCLALSFACIHYYKSVFSHQFLVFKCELKGFGSKLPLFYTRKCVVYNNQRKNVACLTREYNFDIVIVGGGPAGLSAAWSAAKRGVRVAVLEREEAIGHSVRTSGVTWIKEAKSFGIPSDCYNPIRNYSFYSPNNHVIITGSEPQAAVLDVRRTFQFLAYQAAGAGADIFVRTNVTSIIEENGKLVGVKTTSIKDDLVFHSKLVIDASGFYSVIGKNTGTVSQWKRFGVGAEFEAYVDTIDPETWYLMVGQQYSPAGYAWIFPLGKNKIRIGVGVGKPESQVDPTQRLLELIDKNPGPIGDLGRIVPI